MSKRGPNETPTSSGPSAKKVKSDNVLEMGPVSGQEEFDIKLLQIRNRKFAERLKERHVRANMLQQQLHQVQQDKEDRIKSILRLKRYMEELEKGILVSAVAFRGESGAVQESLPEGDILRFSPSELEQFLEDKREVMNKLLVSLKEKDEQPAELEAKAAEATLEFVRELKEKSEGRVTLEEREDQVEVLEERVEDLTNQLEDSRHNEEKYQMKIESLLRRMDELKEELEKRPVVAQESGETAKEKGPEKEEPAPATAKQPTKEHEEEYQDALAEAKELAATRLTQIEELLKSLAEVEQKVEMAELESKSLPETTIKETAVYKSLQSNFSVAYAENLQLRTHLEEAKQLLVVVMSQHHTQFEEVKAEARKAQQEVREELHRVEASYSGTKRELEVLKVEHEKYVAANEQAAPQNKELRKTMASLHKTIQQQKNDIARYKEKAEQAEQKHTKMREERNSDREREVTQQTRDAAELTDLKERVLRLQEENRKLQSKSESKKKGSSSDDREESDEDPRKRKEVIESERALKIEVESLQERLSQMKRDYERRKQQIRDEAAQRQRSLLDETKQLQKDLNAKRHQEEALMKEMEVMGQAWEDMQEQNVRLLDQLQEKDDANFKLMSERVKAINLHRLVGEERDTLTSQMFSVIKERDLLKDALVKWEEKERGHEAALGALERELGLEKQLVEMHKKRAFENAQSLRDVQLKVEEVETHLQEARSRVAEKMDECEKESNLLRRAQEEVSILRRKVDKYKNREQSTMGDEVLLEEIRMYKSKLNCPCCGSRKKDTVLTKCFHVFCNDCIRTRYETRQRKCPKCNATFGFNDYHRIYLS